MSKKLDSRIEEISDIVKRVTEYLASDRITTRPRKRELRDGHLGPDMKVIEKITRTYREKSLRVVGKFELWTEADYVCAPSRYEMCIGTEVFYQRRKVFNYCHGTTNYIPGDWEQRLDELDLLACRRKVRKK